MSDHGDRLSMERMALQIDALPHHLSLYRWLATTLQIGDGLKVVNGRYEPEDEAFIIEFVRWVVAVFNLRDDGDPITEDDAYAAVQEIWDRDALELGRMRARSRVIAK